MSDLSKTVIKLLILLALVGIVINDAAIVATNYWFANGIAKEVADGTVASYKASSGSKNAALAEAYRLCALKQRKLTGFSLTRNAGPKRPAGISKKLVRLRPRQSGSWNWV